jgi:phosphoenolpyruvate carboxykinase (ATP)
MPDPHAHWLARAPGVSRNHPATRLVAAALAAGEGTLSAHGALVCRTGEHTGRSPEDKFVVDEPETTAEVWWGKVNRPMEQARFQALSDRVEAYLATRRLHVQDLHAGADPAYRINVRVITTGAWHALFARNMFIRPSAAELESFAPDWTILHAPDFKADPARDGTRSDCAIVLSLARKRIVICGTSYAGEIKKSIFTVMNWLLPQAGVLPMHCSANVGAQGDSALFFGLSGTGKTTLSSDPDRTLIGDDEHGWSSRGIFNVEGGCYAKVIRLSAEAEPEIFAATHRFGTVLENVVMDEAGRLDLSAATHTENTRACYPIDFVPNASSTGMAGTPQNVVMLTADAFGVLPPISQLSPAQAMYHFLSGYTARVAGTEKGLGAEPQATFSTCFGAPFLPRRPEVYGRMLAENIARSGAKVWLVNTGWTGGGHGTGHRMSIAHTRALLRAALDGTLDGAPMRRDPHFGVLVPEACGGVPASVLNPRDNWPDATAYDQAAAALVGRFARNFTQFEGLVGGDVKEAALRAA